MNQQNPTGDTSDQQGKSATYKRGNRQGRNRPMLVTPATGQTQVEQQSSSLTDGVPTAAGTMKSTPTATVVAPVTKSRPKFFSTVGRKAEAVEEKTVDPDAARLARATRGKAMAAPKKTQPDTVKPQSKAVASTSARPAKSQWAGRGFKPRHFIGIMVYLIAADFLGLYEKSLLVNIKVEKLLFSIGPFPVYVSTAAFLLTLVVLLVILARFDLVPRSLTGGGAGRPSNRDSASGTSNADKGDGNTQPGMRQGVKGSNDDLYVEYRQNQRYWQRRDKKK